MANKHPASLRPKIQYSMWRSVTKTITAEVIVRLADAGTLSLDEPMSPHWVDPDIKEDSRHNDLTPRLALTHKTGFLKLEIYGQPVQITVCC